MDTKAISKYARYSPRKANQVLSQIRGKTVANAYRILPYIPRAASMPVFKTLKSAYSNSGAADPAQIYVKEAWANAGPVFKRVRPMAMGGRGIYKRKTCHITIIVTDQKIKKKK